MKRPSRDGIKSVFQRISQKTAGATGSVWVFLLALVLVIVWSSFGPATHYSENWQLIANTVTNVVTFLMVFLIQNTQNRDSKAIHLKLDELIRASGGARNLVMDLENCTEEEMEELQKEFEKLRMKAVARAQRRQAGEDRSRRSLSTCDAAAEALRREVSQR